MKTPATEKKNNLSISVGIPLTIGVVNGYKSRQNYSQDGKLFLLWHIPLMLNLNIGRGSYKTCAKRKGIFFGLGYGYHYAIVDSNYNINAGGGGMIFLNPHSETIHKSKNLEFVSPVGNLGFRFGVPKTLNNVEVKFTFLMDNKNTKALVLGLAGIYNF